MKIYTAPPNSGDVVLGRTLVDLLDDAVARYPNPTAFNQPKEGGGWTTWSNGDLQTAMEEAALGFRARGVEPGTHVAFWMKSDLHFLLADLATLLAGCVNVPLYTTFGRDNLVYITQHSESKVMVVSNAEMLGRFAEWAGEVPDVKLVVVADGEPGSAALPDGVEVTTMAALREAGRAELAGDRVAAGRLREALDAKKLATLIYTSGTTGQPKGVMLSHENITFNVYAAFTSFGILSHQEEVALTYLPMTHIFARMVVFAHLAWGQSLYFSDPDHLVEHLPAVRPTIFASVPRVLEKVFDKVLLGIQTATGLKKLLGGWAMGMAPTYQTGTTPGGLRGLQFGIADKLVYSKLRERLGLTRIKAVVIGGAALRPDLSNAFNAFGVPTYQGYGLTETSPVITVGTPKANVAGSTGPPIPGVEVGIADDGEILTRGPHVMMGYYKNDEATREVMGAEGWFHTGDIGVIGADNNLRITDRKKALFKLSTGKYVVPQPIENALMESPLIEQAVIVGSDQKYCSALLFPGVEAIRAWAGAHGVTAPADDKALLQEPRVRQEFERLVTAANQGMDPWSQVKRFRLIPELMTVENDLLTPKMSVKRQKVREAYGTDVDEIYAAAGAGRDVEAV